jgi:low temperature requirement protein LtrA
MVAGIVLLALGIKKTVGHEGEELAAMPAFCLAGGVAMYLAAHVAFRWRNTHTLGRRRAAAAAVCLAVFPAATAVPAIVALALVTAVVCGVIGYEAVHFAEMRARVRHAAR